MGAGSFGRAGSESGMTKMTGRVIGVALIVLLPALFDAAHAQSAPDGPDDTGGSASQKDASTLAKDLQNPISDLYSFPFQSNTYFGYGPHGGAQEILNVQPVIPLHVTEDWNVITRTILPLIWNPDLSPAPGVSFGTAPTTFSAFLSPAKMSNGWLWGAGPAIQIPTISDPTMGSSVWGAGPTGVLVYMKGPWVVGALANNIWSLGGRQGVGGNSYNNFLVQPFVNYNFSGGWYIASSPIITAGWQISGPKWTVPLGGSIGRVIRIGKLPVSLSIGGYYNALRPVGGASWQMRTQLTLIF
jgi:hypothetical protein